MSAINQPLVYLVLGASGSGRREVLADLLTGIAGDDVRSCLLVSETEQPAPAPVTEEIAASATISPWKFTAERAVEAEFPEGMTHIFWLLDGARSPVDQLEAVREWLRAKGIHQIARILCVVHCRLAEAHHELLAWYDACIHFADVVLLHQREGVQNKWMSDFQGRYKDQFYPCLFEMVKQGRVKNPALVLEPEARRMSQAFDDEVLGAATMEHEGLVEIGFDEDDDSEEAGLDAEADERGAKLLDGDEDALPEEPYFARRLGGRRVREIPDVAKFLPAK